MILGNFSSPKELLICGTLPLLVVDAPSLDSFNNAFR